MLNTSWESQTVVKSPRQFSEILKSSWKSQKIFKSLKQSSKNVNKPQKSQIVQSISKKTSVQWDCKVPLQSVSTNLVYYFLINVMFNVFLFFLLVYYKRNWAIFENKSELNHVTQYWENWLIDLSNFHFLKANLWINDGRFWQIIDNSTTITFFH